MSGLDYSHAIARTGAFPEDSNLPDRVVDLANLAMDPIYDVEGAEDVGALQSGVTAMNADTPTLDFRRQPTYEAGGMIGPGGQPVRSGGLNTQQTSAVTPEAMQQEIQRLVRDHPERVVHLRDAVMQALQSGELTPDELNMIAQLAMATAQNPEVYPQVRQFAIAQGLATDQDLPQQYDPGLVFTLLLIVQAAQQQLGGSPVPTGQSAGQPQSAGQAPVGSFMKGGALPAQSHNADGSIKINAHEGEYVVPRHVVQAKGTEFFDKLVGQYDSGKPPT